MSNDTIFAPATPAGTSAIGVIRVSGGNARCACQHITGKQPPEPRLASLVKIRNPVSGALIDQALILWFKAPNSATGEDVLEIHHHGGVAVQSAVLQALATVSGMRAADPGEFSRRAFLAGKLDLTSLEGVADLIEARTSDQARQAARQMDGELMRLYSDWRNRILECLALAEAEIDFADEEADVEGADRASIVPRLRSLRDDIEKQLQNTSGIKLRDGLSFVIVGPPNSGKSSLINILVRQDVAIVSPFLGTTRDPIAVELDVAGIPVTLVDTAGMRETDDEIEIRGIERALRRAAQADLLIEVVDSAHSLGFEWQRPVECDNRLIVRNKSDLLDRVEDLHGHIGYRISCKTKAGIDELWQALEAWARRLAGCRSDQTFGMTNVRHRQLLAGTLQTLDALCVECDWHDKAIICEQLRLCARYVGQLSGLISAEDVLDAIFSRFCIGK